MVVVVFQSDRYTLKKKSWSRRCSGARWPTRAPPTWWWRRFPKEKASTSSRVGPTQKNRYFSVHQHRRCSLKVWRTLSLGYLRKTLNVMIHFSNVTNVEYVNCDVKKELIEKWYILKVIGAPAAPQTSHTYIRWHFTPDLLWFECLSFGVFSLQEWDHEDRPAEVSRGASKAPAGEQVSGENLPDQRAQAAAAQRQEGATITTQFMTSMFIHIPGKLISHLCCAEHQTREGMVSEVHEDLHRDPQEAESTYEVTPPTCKPYSIS